MKQIYALFFLALAATATHSAPVSIDFEEYDGSVGSLDPVLADTDVGNGFLMSPGSVSPPLWLDGVGPGTVTVALSTSGGHTIVFDRDDSLSFDLLDFDYTAGANGNYSMLISGTKVGGAIVSQSFNWEEVAIYDWSNFSDTSLFQGLTSLTIQATDSSGIGIVVDNFHVNVVPIPGAVWLFGSALAGLGWLRRKV